MLALYLVLAWGWMSVAAHLDTKTFHPFVMYLCFYCKSKTACPYSLLRLRTLCPFFHTMFHLVVDDAYIPCEDSSGTGEDDDLSMISEIDVICFVEGCAK